MPNAQRTAECPHCAARLRVRKPELIGTRVKCPRCKQPFTIEVPSDILDVVDEVEPSESDLEETEIAEDEWGESEEIIDEVEFFDEPLRDRHAGKRRRDGAKARDVLRASDPEQATASLYCAACLVTVCVVMLGAAIAAPGRRPEITRYGELETDQKPDYFADESGRTGRIFFEECAAEVLRGSAGEVVRALGDIEAGTSEIPEPSIPILMKQAIQDERLEVLLKLTELTELLDRSTRNDFYARLATESDARLVATAVEGVRGRADEFGARTLMRAFENGTSRGFDTQPAREAIVALPESVRDGVARQATVDATFRLYQEVGGPVVLDPLILKRFEAGPKSRIETPAIKAAIDEIWQRTIEAARRDGLKIVDGRVLVGENTSGPFVRQLTWLEIPEDVRELLVEALRNDAEKIDRDDPDWTTARHYVLLTREWDDRSARSILEELTGESGTLSEEMFKVVASVDDLAIAEELTRGLTDGLVPTRNVRLLFQTYKDVAPRALFSDDPAVITTAANFLTGRLVLDPDRPLGTGELPRGGVEALHELAARSELHRMVANSILAAQGEDQISAGTDAAGATPDDSGPDASARLSEQELVARLLAPPPGFREPDIRGEALANWIEQEGGAESRSLARALVFSPSAKSGILATIALLRFGQPGDVKAVLAGLDDPSRVRASSIAQWCPSRPIQAPLLELLAETTDPSARARFIHLIGQVCTSEAASVLAPIAEGGGAEGTPAQRALEQVRLRESPSPGRDDIVEQALRDWHVEINSSRAWREVDPGKSVEFLASDKDLEQLAGLVRLAETPWSTPPHGLNEQQLLTWSEGDDFGRAFFAARVLGRAFPEQSAARWRGPLETAEGPERLIALAALAETSDAEVAAKFADDLKNPKTAPLAFAVLLRQAGRGDGVVPTVIEPLLDDADPALAVQAARVLARSSDPESRHLIERQKSRYPVIATIFEGLLQEQASRLDEHARQ